MGRRPRTGDGCRSGGAAASAGGARAAAAPGSGTGKSVYVPFRRVQLQLQCELQLSNSPIYEAHTTAERADGTPSRRTRGEIRDRAFASSCTHAAPLACAMVLCTAYEETRCASTSRKK